MEKHTITPKQIAKGLHEMDKRIDQANRDVLHLEVELLISKSWVFVKYVGSLLKEAKSKRKELIDNKEKYIKFFILD